ncbi:MAG: uroporphyrinogen-III synthase [Candidatus Fluviicola riflensis]|nr:MAG: uroporphyrinogen-III synthase [Candidatus Fluviicola riflensis]OGS77783.1 MAG: uroporphyrinogen-III synthase [Candidatus Fluviicola riflensis]OGS84366.1 MAG: uroporphyrinogen-III synthase [Fluviicola sp. RIFCSPHIGHO2_12_FULL_43_24]OGS84848.1 MAG: uroporphyrinogen-III synthase [Fluviicola sp. RIFCSPHIGHO2_01_FULL_43_53]
MSIKTILVSQPKPEGEKSPYYDLADKYKLKIDFRPFIHVEGIAAQEFRQQKVNIPEYTAIILTSKTAVDHFFRIAEETRFEVPDSMKYFCISEAVALYLQKYVTYRKRKIFFGKQTIEDLIDPIKKHKTEKFLLPCTDILRDKIPETLEAAKIPFTKAMLYRTVASDLSDLEDVYYDMLVFFSPGGIESLMKNFPDFKQNTTVIAAFGPTTANAVIKNNLRLDVHAPMPNAPSMTAAIEQFIKEYNKKK